MSIIDPTISMAMAVQASKGAYALLLGSGISRSAGIPTGWEIMCDLIRPVAKASGEENIENPEDWYAKKYGKAPTYNGVLKALGQTAADRNKLLFSYFEPDEDDRQNHRKEPTPAHERIAELVAKGYIKIIVTTNFDRLMENALAKQGIEPIVVSTDDDIRGMVPLSHLPSCLVVKINGDYRNVNSLNTSDELENYSQDKTQLLDRIFHEYGLIVCGWSGEWDEALRNAIVRNTRFVYGMYWMAHQNKILEKAQHLIDLRKGELLDIKNADQAFQDLANKVEAIEQHRMVNPLSAPVAVAMAKRFLADDRHRIDFEDLVRRELDQIQKKTSRERMPIDSTPPDEKAYTLRAEQIDQACRILAPVVAVGVMYDQKGMYNDLWKECIETLMSNIPYPSQASIKCLGWLQYAPAMMIAYSAGAAAIVAKRFDVFKTIFIDSIYNNPLDRQCFTAIHWITASYVFTEAPLPQEKTSFFWCSDRLESKLEEMLGSVLPRNVKFEDLFNDLETVVSLISAGAGISIPKGRFMVRREGKVAQLHGTPSLLYKLEWELQPLLNPQHLQKPPTRPLAERSHVNAEALLKAGLFNKKQLSEAIKKVQDCVQSLR